jgi:uncharacterized protein YkwD
MKKLITLLIAIFAVLSLQGQPYSQFYDELPDVNNCTPGVLKEAEKQKVLNLINEIRAVHSLNPVTYDYSGDKASQEATTLLCANETLTHYPSEDMTCYTEDAYTGCAMSNLHLGFSSGMGVSSSESSVVGWLIDNKSLNAQDKAGHRRAIINPFLTRISFGRTDHNNGQWLITSMSLYYGDYVDGVIDETENDFVAYPYHNYRPAWVDKSFYLSFSAFHNMNTWYDNKNIDYSSATITMTTESGQPVNTHSQKSDDEGWGSIPTSMVWKADGLQDEVKYNVEIKNVIVDGKSRDYSYWFELTDDGTVVEKFLPPDIIYPESNAKDIPLEISLQWEAVENAESYDLILEKEDRITGEIEIVVDVRNITATEYDVQIEKATNYSWQLRAVNSDETSDWSSKYKFTTEGLVPVAPVLVYPINNSYYVDSETYFEWEPVNGADNYIFTLSYRMNGEETYVYDSEYVGDMTIFKPENELVDGYYNWEVRSVIDGVISDESTAKFTLIDGGNNQPELLTPENNASVPLFDIFFDWEDIADAQSYELKIYTENTEMVFETDESEFTLSEDDALDDKTEYNWTVRANFGDMSGETEYGLWSEPFVIQTDTESSVKWITDNDEISFSPNPVKDRIIIETEYIINSSKIYDINGNSIELNINQLDVSNLANGVYILELNTSNGIYREKFIKE